MNRKSIFACFIVGALWLTSCGNKPDKSYENKEEAKVGKVYDHEQQGVDIENRDNQFPSSRNDSKEGTGQELGAPTDTIDGDGDKVKVNNQTNDSNSSQRTAG